MKIVDVRAFPLRVPFTHTITIASPGAVPRDFVDVLIVCIDTDEGITGIGETQAWRREGSSETVENLYHVVNNVFRPLLLGRSPFDISHILARLTQEIYGSYYPQAAIGDALYDIMGKAVGRPVHDLLGGGVRTRIQVSTSIATQVAEEVVDSAHEFYAEGYRHLRLKMGIDPARDFRNFEALKKEFGDKITLRGDANAGMTFADALPLLKKIEQFEPDYVEQPISGNDIAGMAALARAVSYPIGADESLTTHKSLLEIIKHDAARIVQTKTGKNGGIHYIQKLWATADAAGITVYPGNHPATSISVAAVAHMCAAWPGRLMVSDFQVGATHIMALDTVTQPIRNDKGWINVPQGPGLGVELDMDAIAKMRLDL